MVPSSPCLPCRALYTTSGRSLRNVGNQVGVGVEGHHFVAGLFQRLAHHLAGGQRHLALEGLASMSTATFIHVSFVIGTPRGRPLFCRGFLRLGHLLLGDLDLLGIAFAGLHDRLLVLLGIDNDVLPRSGILVHGLHLSVVAGSAPASMNTR